MQDLIIRKTSTILGDEKAKFLRTYFFKEKEVYT